MITDERICGALLGSSIALRRECEELAKALGVPLDLDPESDPILAGGDGSERWHAYPVESHVCLVLHHAAVTSVATGAAIVFC